MDGKRTHIQAQKSESRLILVTVFCNYEPNEIKKQGSDNNNKKQCGSKYLTQERVDPT